MKKYAHAECFYCHQVLPKPEMQKKAKWVGWAGGIRMYHRRQGTSTFATNFPWYHIYVCPDCQRSTKNDRLFTVIGLSIVAAFLAFIFIVSHH